MEQEKLETLRNVIYELKTAPRHDINALMDKYDMTFRGENFNTVNSLELAHYLKDILKVDISNEELIDFLPTATNWLNIKLEPMVAVKDVGKINKVHSYLIHLY